MSLNTAKYHLNVSKTENTMLFEKVVSNLQKLPLAKIQNLLSVVWTCQANPLKGTLILKKDKITSF